MNSWLQLSITINEHHAELASDYLQALGALAVSLDAASDEPIFNERGPIDKLWQNTHVSALFSHDSDLQLISTQLTAWLPCPVTITIKAIEEQDWVRSSQSHFTANDINGLWVYPIWHTDSKQNPHITITPGLGFGTGTHPTTRLCLQFLASTPPVDQRVIDYGCGSGILSLAAAQLGASHVTGIDHDQQALIASRDNLNLNQQLNPVIHFYLDSSEYTLSPAHLVIANIISSVLYQLHDQLYQLTLPGGHLLLSGILNHEVEDVISHFSSNFQLIQPYSEQEWSALLFKKLS